MIEFSSVIEFEQGLHARPASELVKVCQKIKSDIKITKGDMTVNPKSILGILTLAASSKDRLNISIEGEDEEQGSQALKDFFARTDLV